MREGGRFRCCAAAVVLSVLLTAPLFAQSSSMIRSDKIATRFGLNHRTLQDPDKRIIGAKLWNDQHELILLVNLRYAIVDGEIVWLQDEIVAEDGQVSAPPELLRTLRARMPAVGGASQDEANGRLTVVIDPGHGGRDPGAIGARGTREKDVNLAVSLILAEALRDEDVNVILTRSKDVFIPLERRAQIANEAVCDLFVSIHSNAFTSSHPEGFLVITPADDWNDSSLGNVVDRALEASEERGLVLKGVSINCPSQAATATIYAAALEAYRLRSMALAASIRNALAKQVRTTDRGSFEDSRGLRVLRKTYCPAVLVELDFLSNVRGEQRLSDGKFQKRLAIAVAEGIMAYLGK